jgi:hypothetical protein
MEEARSLLGSLPRALRAEAGAYARVLDGGIASVPSAGIRASGYVVHCLEASLWCLVTTTDYQSCVLAAVNLGEDADTTGAVAGGLAGLAYGIDALPEEWLRSLVRRAEIEALSERLASLVTAPAPLPRSYWVLPGKLLAGGYPGRGRSGSVGGAEGSPGAAVNALIDSGVDAFLDLTAPGEDLGAERYDVLLDSAASGRGLSVVRRESPLADMTAESAAVVKALGDLDSLMEGGKTVYLHCLGGLGRTGTLVGAYLVEKGLAPPDEAVSLINALRAGTDRSASDSPQTDEQRRLVASTRPGPEALPL